MSFWKKKEKTGLEEVRDAAISELKGLDENTDEYKVILKRVAKLTELINLERGTDDKVSKDVVVKIAGSALLTLIFVGYESRHAITTKAPSIMNFLPLHKS